MMTADNRDGPLSLGAVQLGMLWTAVAFSAVPLLGSDNFVLLKGLVLVTCAFASATLELARRSSLEFDRTDALLVVVLIAGAIGSIGAVNAVYSTLAFGSLASSFVLFWTARSLASHGYRANLLAVVSLTICIIAVSGLAEAYTPIEISAPRMPGGTIGNRNRLAHLLVIGAPAMVVLGVRLRARARFTILLFGVALASWMLVLSRTRAAWLALILLVCTGFVLHVYRRRHGLAERIVSARRGMAIVFAVTAGVVLALLLPNRLQWNSQTPYRDSISTLLEYRTGSGAGRLNEQWNTVRMIRDQPLLGVGPGNWRVHYPRYASVDDPTITSEIVPVRRFTQGGWLGLAAEWGLPALLLLGVFVGIMCVRWLGAIISPAPPRVMTQAFAGLLTAIGILVIGAFDPVVQTPAAGYAVPVLLGALVLPGRRMHIPQAGRTMRLAAAVGVAVVGVLLTEVWVKELWAARLYGYQPTYESIRRTVEVHQGSYMVQFAAAAAHVARGDCAGASVYLDAARRLYPTAGAVDLLVERCRADDSGQIRVDVRIGQDETEDSPQSPRSDR